MAALQVVQSPPVRPRYEPFIRRTCAFVKIPGCEPSQISPGYEQRLAALVAASGCEAASARRLAGVYVRRGCVELLIEAEEWGGVDSGDEEARPCTGADTCTSTSDDSGTDRGWNDPGAGFGTRAGAERQTRQEPGGGAMTAPGQAPGLASTGSGMSLEAACSQGESLFQPSAHPFDRGSPNRLLAVTATAAPDTLPTRAGNAAAAASWAPYAGGGSRRRRSSVASTSTTTSTRSVDLASIIRALQLREDGGGASPLDDDVVLSSGDMGGGESLLGSAPDVVAPKAPTSGSGAGALAALETREEADPQLRREAVAMAIAGPDSLRVLAPPGLQGAPHLLVPLRLGSSGDRQVGIEVTALQPRVLVARAGLSEAIPPPVQQLQPMEQLAPQQAVLAAAGTAATAALAAAPGGDGGGAWAAAALLHAVVHCAADLQAGCPPSPLEVLVRSHSEYLPVRARWTGTDGAAGNADAASRPALGTAAAVAAEVRLLPGPQGRLVSDVASRPDVNLPQLLDLELLELPCRPGIALVDFRWYGKPCRTVPLVLTSDPAVALELQPIIAQWPRAQSELDEFLLDFGTWEFHAFSASAGAGAAAPGPQPALDPVSLARLIALGGHLLRYVTACNWAHTTAHMRRLMTALAARVAATSAPPRRAEGAAACGSGCTAGTTVAEAAAAAAAKAVSPEGVGERPGCTHGWVHPSALDGAQPAAAPKRHLGCKDGGCRSSAAGCGGDVSTSAAAEGRSGGGVSCKGAGACGNGRLRTALALLLLAIGLRRGSPDEEEAFREYADPWVFAQGRLLTFLDFVSLLTLLFRARHDLLAPCNLTALVACSGGALTMLALPFVSRRRWAQLVRAYRLPRFLMYSTTKCMIAFLGFPPPPGILSYATGSSLLLMEGVIAPGASLLPAPTAAVVLALLASASACMIRACGAPAIYAVLVGLRTWALGVLTTVACHAYMRACCSRRQERMGRLGRAPGLQRKRKCE